MSGRLPIHVNVENLPNITSPGGIDLRMTLLPQMLRRAGYETAVGLECAPLLHAGVLRGPPGAGRDAVTCA